MNVEKLAAGFYFAKTASLIGRNKANSVQTALTYQGFVKSVAFYETSSQSTASPRVVEYIAKLKL